MSSSRERPNTLDSPLGVAVWENNFEAVQELLATSPLPTRHTRELLVVAMSSAQFDPKRNPPGLEILRALLAAGVDPNPLDGYGQNLLHWACSCAAPTKIVGVILPYIKDINATTAQGETVLDVCRQHGRVSRSVLKMLRDRGARPSESA